jgi:hypothetical membrane protein
VRTRRLLVGGVVGPVAFAAAWLWGSATTDGYSMVAQPISRLAAVGTPSRAVMTTGLLVFAGGVGAYSLGLRHELRGPAWIAAATTAAASVGIAATPLDGRWGDVPHATAAGIAYASLVALELVGADPLADATGRPVIVAISRAAAVISAVGLAVNAFGPESITGLAQRVGLTAGHAWIVASAVLLLRRER